MPFDLGDQILGQDTKINDDQYWRKSITPEHVLRRLIKASLILDSDASGSYFWQLCASLLPLTTAPIGFLGNLASIISLADPWRLVDGTDHNIQDTAWVLALNSVALAAGVLANVLLFMNFCKLLPHIFVQTASIILYMFAVILYMALFGATEYQYFHNGVYWRSQGYWQGASASVLYGVAAIFLTLNLVGHLTKRYDGEHYLNNNQRRVYLVSLALIGWVAIGGAVFQQLINLSYANACYFCIVSFFTLGFGDIVPKTVAARIVIIPFIYMGVILIGVSVVSIYTVIREHHISAALMHRVHFQRTKAFACISEDTDATDRDSYDVMRAILKRAHLYNEITSTFLVMLWLLIFWLLGALVYHGTEGWTYFEAFYFVSIVLATVGYGDFTPDSRGGRSFFIMWVFFAIPTMTSAISSVTDIMSKIVEFIIKTVRTKSVQRKTMMNMLMMLFQSDMYEERREELSTELLEGTAIALIHGADDKAYPFEVWHFVTTKLIGELPCEFWLSDLSPLTRPINERKCLLLMTLHCLGMKGERAQTLLEQVLVDPSVDLPSRFETEETPKELSPVTSRSTGFSLSALSSRHLRSPSRVT